MTSKMRDMIGNCAAGTASGFICGCEYEIEAINGHGPIADNSYILNITKDGSLRNNGYEYITKPIRYDQQLQFFEYLHKHISIKAGQNGFTDRTSIHVHVNVGNLTEQQTRNLMLCYAVLEPYFFSLVNPNRKHNIHCVPLNYTYLPAGYSKDVPTQAKTWSKYTAFNLLPAVKQCTVEFRHLHGTNNKQVFERWLGTIKSLYDFVENSPEFHLGNYLSQGGTASSLFQKIFNKSCPLDESVFESSIIDVKESFV